MSLAIDISGVTRVLLADGWHDVETGSFNCDAFELVWPDDAAYRDRGAVFQFPSCAVGMEWEELRGGRVVRVSAPLTSLIAVEWAP